MTQYVMDEQTVRITVGRAASKTWWRNFRTAHPVQLRLAGEGHDALAHVVGEGDTVCVVADIGAHPRS
ncbi:MAG: hypothetical protein ABIQ09_16075 [Jatrophihabitantaceae bacterium]